MSTTESQINEILAHPFDHEWSIQGFGMLRAYLDDEHIERLHIWDLEAAVDEVSTIHDHPWDFTSRIVRGHLVNQRYKLDAPEGLGGEWCKTAKIRCGEGGGMLSEPRATFVRPQPHERYKPGESYAMEAPEFHESFPARGTVTVIARSFHADRDVATVCWSRRGEWVSAEPRPATRAEIEHFTLLAAAAHTG